MADDITATITRYIPVPVLNVDAEMPLSLQGDTAERPSPAPNAIRRRASAAAPTAPAATAAQDTLDCASMIVDARTSVSIRILPERDPLGPICQRGRRENVPQFRKSCCLALNLKYVSHDRVEVEIGSPGSRRRYK